MSKEDNPILNIMEADESRRAAMNPQVRAEMQLLRHKLCGWIDEAKKNGITIACDKSNRPAVWIDVKRSICSANLYYDGNFGSGCHGNIFGPEFDSDALDDLRRIVDALEKGTACIRRTPQ